MIDQVDPLETSGGDVYQESGEWVLCSGEIVVKDTTPGEETYGFQGTRTWGYGYDIDITFSRRLETGSAVGNVELYTETVDECAGVHGGDAVAEQGTLEVSLTGAGELASFKGRGSYQIPSEHSSYRGKERAATGTVVAGSVIDRALDLAYMSQVTWTEHTNS